MEINVLIFGQLTEITGTDKLSLSGTASSEEVIKQMQQKFPALVNSQYRLAVNKKIIAANIALASGDVVALLPPFSGG